MKGKFIVIEGCDFTGKSTVIEKLVVALKDLGIEACQMKALGETDYGIARRKFLMENKETLSNEEQAIIMIDAMQDMNRKLLIKQEGGNFVVCDRYCHSTLVYQGMRKNALKMVEEQLSEANLIKPDLTIILDCDTSIILERMKERAEKNVYDPKSAKEVEEIRNAYLKVAQMENTVIINTTNLTTENVIEKILGFI